MKSFSKLVLILVLVAAFTVPAFAQTSEHSSVRPGSFFYGFVTTFEKIDLFFTFNSEKKAEKALKYADKRLAEAEAVAGDENSDAVKTAIAGYEKNMALASEASKKVLDEAKAENLLNLIADNTSKHQGVLLDVLAKVPEEAREAIAQAIEASRKGQEEAIKKIAELKQEVVELKQEVAELKKQQGTESTPPQSTDAQIQSTSIKELKKEIEELKKQVVDPSVPPTTQATTPQTEFKLEDKAVTLTNSLGVSYVFDDPMINQQRIRDLVKIGFVVTKGKLPEGIIIEPITETPMSVPESTTQIQDMLKQIRQDVQQIKQNTISSTPELAPQPPPVKKELSIFAVSTTLSDGRCSEYPAPPGIYCQLEIKYFENGAKKLTPVTISSNDNGKFRNWSGADGSENNPLTATLSQNAYDGTRLFFNYFPDTSDERILTPIPESYLNSGRPLRFRTITATANGVVTTKDVFWVISQ